jgi:murein DD-endopeptidase MepM/ murein hydrolase activator NlpD
LIRAALIVVVAGLAGVAFAQDTGDKPAHPMFRWPVTGKAVKAKNGGLDIPAPEGEAVHAAADGSVIYASDDLPSFGKMIVIRHGDDYVTAYAYLSELAVAQGVSVKRGQIIGKSGQSGDAKKPELHFELRKGTANVDPIGYMAPR